MEYLPSAFVDHDVSCHFTGRYSHKSMYHDPLDNLCTVQDSITAVGLLQTLHDVQWAHYSRLGNYGSVWELWSFWLPCIVLRSTTKIFTYSC